jgi:hypothetical protein
MLPTPQLTCNTVPEHVPVTPPIRHLDTNTLRTLVISSLSVHTTFVDTDKPLGLHYTAGY